ncbi:MAG: hypothetical protein HUJ30_07865 [Gammaproteobacteria bacterium]|nr:hypothetical protein [Gammaproteobacteria bacterium]
MPSRDLGFERSFLIESVTSGVDITSFQHYGGTHKKSKPIAILRLETDWFQDIERSMVRGYMLNYIKADYDFSTIFKIALDKLAKMYFKIRRPKISEAIKNKRIPNQFICSGFIQYGYFTTAQKLIDNEKLPPEAMDSVLFHKELTGSPSEKALLSVTPEDLADSEHLSWKYVIKDGTAYKVKSAAHGKSLLESKKT